MFHLWLVFLICVSPLSLVNASQAQPRELTLRSLENLWTLDSAKFDSQFCVSGEKITEKEVNTKEIKFVDVTDVKLKKALWNTSRAPFSGDFVTIHFKDGNGQQCRCAVTLTTNAEKKTVVEAKPNDKFDLSAVIVKQTVHYSSVQGPFNVVWKGFLLPTAKYNEGDNYGARNSVTGDWYDRDLYSLYITSLKKSP